MEHFHIARLSPCRQTRHCGVAQYSVPAVIQSSIRLGSDGTRSRDSVLLVIAKKPMPTPFAMHNIMCTMTMTFSCRSFDGGYTDDTASSSTSVFTMHRCCQFTTYYPTHAMSIVSKTGTLLSLFY